MGAGRAVGLAAFGEAVTAVRAHRLQQCVPAAPAGARGVRDHQGPVDQAEHDPGDLAPVGHEVCAHLFGGDEREGSGEHREASEHSLLELVEQLVGPIDHGAQGALPLGHAPANPAQQQEPRVEAGSKLGGAHGAQARRGELDRERQPVQSAADLGDRRNVGRLEGEAGGGVRGAVQQ
ncbi:hypothetical protein PHK61_30975 [Actinomycetospora lutea]|uniref:hypothetical protein n=1 Tax=Actinomycetospora lutea TaxID=663604 RepID=UPI0023664E9D|nr:hypothetical protein [Actinomycetospora lutea]MDD7942845.1 hypothetical protein [Actinomycetospora lutea]